MLACVTHGATIGSPRGLPMRLRCFGLLSRRNARPSMVSLRCLSPSLSTPAFEAQPVQPSNGNGGGRPLSTRADAARNHQNGLKEITIGFGMTRTSPTFSRTNKDDPIERRVGTVGRIARHVEIKIVVGGPCCSSRAVWRDSCSRRERYAWYWNDEAQTNTAINSAAGCAPVIWP